MAAARLTALAVALGLLMPGVSPGAVCKYEKPPPRLSPAEEVLRETISIRKAFGLPHGRAFVRRINADAAARRRARAIELIGFPMTAHELWYMRMRERFEHGPASRRLYRYLRTQRATLAGTSIEDDYPRSPYMLIHFTRDLARQRRAIAKRFPLRFVVHRVRYTQRELFRIQDSIDFDELEREGIHFVSSVPEPERSRVRLEVTTARSDVREVVRRLYGPAVFVRVIATTPTYLACSSPETYSVSEDGRTLDVSYIDSGSVTPRYVEIVETPTEVRVGIVTEVPRGVVTSDAVPYTLSVTLSEPLGDRVVRSIRSGRRVKRGTS